MKVTRESVFAVPFSDWPGNSDEVFAQSNDVFLKTVFTVMPSISGLAAQATSFALKLLGQSCFKLISFLNNRNWTDDLWSLSYGMKTQ